METVGLAVTEAPEAALKPVAGLQVKETAPPAVKVADSPAQIVAEETVMTGKGFTVTEAVAEPVHPEASVPVTV